MNIIVAYRFEHADYFARHIKHWPKSEYKIVCSDQPDYMRGLRDVTIWIVDGPRYRPSMREMDNRYEIRCIINHLHNVTVIEETIP